MATITIGSTAGQRPYLQLNVWESATNTGANQSTVSFSLILKRPSRISSSATKYWSASIDGQNFSGSGSIGGSGDKTLLTGSKVVGHNADGSKSIGFSASASLNITWSGQWLGTISGSGSMGLTKIPRYFSSCSAWVSSRTETQVTVSWKTAETCNGVTAVYDGSEHWLGDPNGTSGSITLTMNPDTSKNIYFRLRRKDSNLVSNTNQVSASTYAYPYVQYGTDFVIGDALRLNVYNPLNHSYVLNVYASNGSVIGGYEGSGTVLNGFNDSNSIDLMYKNCANRSDTYHVTIDYDGHVSTYDKGNTYSADKAVPVVGNVVISDTKTFTGIHKQATELIKGKSAIRATISSVSAQKYAKLRKITVSYDGIEKSKSWTGETESDSNIAFDFTTSNGSELTVTVEDSRGLKSTRKIQLSFLQFAMPSLTLTAERGIYDTVYKTWKSDANHGTYAKCTLGGSTDSHLDIDASKSVIKINNTDTSISSFGDMYIGGGNLIYTSGYHIEATLFDALGQSATAVADIASGSRIMTIINDEGIAFGGMAEKGKFKIYDNLEFNGCIFPVGYIYISASPENPSTWFGGTWKKINGRYLLAAGDDVYVPLTSEGSYFTLNKRNRVKWGRDNSWVYKDLDAGTYKAENKTFDDQDPSSGHQKEVWARAEVGLEHGAMGQGMRVSTFESKGYGLTKAETFMERVIVSSGTYRPCLPPTVVVYMWQRTA